MKEKEFYERCATLLGVEHEYRDPTPVPKMPDRQGNIRNTYKNRYNGRIPGNGRFPGSGIVRNFGLFIQVRLSTPSLHGNFKSFDEALQAITDAMTAHTAMVVAIAAAETEKALADNPVGYRTATDEEIDLARRQLHRGNKIVAAALEAATTEIYAEGEKVIAARKPRFANKQLCPRCDKLVSGRCDAEICGYL